jgi:hypothetical protein
MKRPRLPIDDKGTSERRHERDVKFMKCTCAIGHRHEIDSLNGTPADHA